MRKLIGCCCAGFAAICCAQTPDESSVVMGSPAAVVAAKDGDIRTESAKFEIPTFYELNRKKRQRNFGGIICIF